MQGNGNTKESLGIDWVEKNKAGRQEESSPKTTHQSSPPMGGFCVVKEWDRIRPDQIPGF